MTLHRLPSPSIAFQVLGHALLALALFVAFWALHVRMKPYELVFQNQLESWRADPDPNLKDLERHPNQLASWHAPARPRATDRCPCARRLFFCNIVTVGLGCAYTFVPERRTTC